MALTGRWRGVPLLGGVIEVGVAGRDQRYAGAGVNCSSAYKGKIGVMLRGGVDGVGGLAIFWPSSDRAVVSMVSTVTFPPPSSFKSP